MSVLFNPKSLEESFVSFSSGDKANFLKLYREACSETSCPKSDRLTQLILGAATDPNSKPEVVEPALAILQTLALQGFAANPFSGNLVLPSQSDKAAGVVLVPGKTLAGTDLVFITAFEPTNRQGEKLGRKLAFFAAPENLTDAPLTFNHNIEKIGGLKGWHGHDGWNFDPKRCGTPSYEDGLFKGYQDGSAIGKLTAPLLELVNGGTRDKPQTSGVENMVVLSKNPESPLHNTFVKSSSIFAQWSQACTETRVFPDLVPSVHFPAGEVGWVNKVNARSCVRPLVALELSHLTL